MARPPKRIRLVSASKARVHSGLAGIRRVGLHLRLGFVRPHRFELRRKGVRRRILRLLCNSACVRIIADPLTVSAFSSLAWHHCRIART